MVPSPRYLALSKAVHEMRGGDFEFSIKGLDELVIAHDSVMVEACNSCFQVHLQVDADQFAQPVQPGAGAGGPAARRSRTNSPLLFGKRLWSETRIALFQQAVDTRSKTLHARDAQPARHLRHALRREVDRRDLQGRHRALPDAGGHGPRRRSAGGARPGLAPQLKALRLHNGTIYRWNRACYGIIDGKPHLRIENRVMPSGPSVADEVANAAFWCGLMVGSARSTRTSPSTSTSITRRATSTRRRARASGAHFHWLDGQEVPAQKLVLDTLMPVAEAGLQAPGRGRGRHQDATWASSTRACARAARARGGCSRRSTR